MGMKWLRQKLNKSKKPGSRLSPWTVFIIVICVLIEVGLIVAIFYILSTQGPTQAVSVLSVIAGVGALLGIVPALLLAYLQWHEPRTPKDALAANNAMPLVQVQPLVPTAPSTQAPSPLNTPSQEQIQSAVNARPASGATAPPIASVHSASNMASASPNVSPQNARPPIFISYNSADSKKAKWIEEVLNQAGYATILGMDVPGTNPVIETDEALKAVKHTIVVISPDYLKENPEVWPNVFRTDKSSRQRALLPVYVRDSSQFLEKGFLGGITGIDLVGKSDDQACKDLIEGIRLSVDGLRKAPTMPPSFPGSS